ncbi:MAG: hypothetical protein AMXMBFR56_81410 [Polyangiaceae bacterium]
MNLSGRCPHSHCSQKQTFVVRANDEERHLTCTECGWPVVLTHDGERWLGDRGYWGPAGDDYVFHGAVCALFHAEMGAVNQGPDCYSGHFDGIDYDHVEAKCHGEPVNASIVKDAIDKYGRGGESLALVAGQPAFTSPAIELATDEDVHLFAIARTERGYSAFRVA